MPNKDTSFTPEKQAEYIQSELDRMELMFQLMQLAFGEKEFHKRFLEKNNTYQKWSAIKESLDRLSMLQENMGKVGNGLYEHLTSTELTKGQILDAIIDFNSNKK